MNRCVPRRDTTVLILACLLFSGISATALAVGFLSPSVVEAPRPGPVFTHVFTKQVIPYPPPVDCEGDPGGYARKSGVIESLSGEDRTAYITLANAPMFSTGGVGSPGRLPKAVLAYRTLIESPRAAEAFDEMARIATPEGRMYALCGLYDTDPRLFAKDIKEITKDSGRVLSVGFGCSIFKEKVTDLLPRIQRGEASWQLDGFMSFLFTLTWLSGGPTPHSRQVVFLRPGEIRLYRSSPQPRLMVLSEGERRTIVSIVESSAFRKMLDAQGRSGPRFACCDAEEIGFSFEVPPTSSSILHAVSFHLDAPLPAPLDELLRAVNRILEQQTGRPFLAASKVEVFRGKNHETR